MKSPDINFVILNVFSQKRIIFALFFYSFAWYREKAYNIYYGRRKIEYMTLRINNLYIYISMRILLTYFIYIFFVLQ